MLKMPVPGSGAIPILMYHQVASLPREARRFRSLTVEPGRFRSHMQWLKRLGYRGLSVRDALPFIRGEKTGRVAVITFDDGFLNVLENAGPVLAECGFTATNYMVANQVGGSNVWNLAGGGLPSPLMSAAQLRAWAALGHEVGAHTLDHVNLARTAHEEEARRQIAGSKAILEDILGQGVENFSYPYGGFGPLHCDMVREAGFDSAVTTVERRCRTGDDLFGLPRIKIGRRDAWPMFLARLIRN